MSLQEQINNFIIPHISHVSFHYEKYLEFLKTVVPNLQPNDDISYLETALNSEECIAFEESSSREIRGIVRIPQQKSRTSQTIKNHKESENTEMGNDDNTAESDLNLNISVQSNHDSEENAWEKLIPISSFAMRLTGNPILFSITTSKSMKSERMHPAISN
ncbi:hypothetical protein HK098_008389 [Nowakowskiella sp. JEL0407]|nr:hypothetical protein HK098_008389 [Nowakowskiella sp. JEL0407]